MLLSFDMGTKNLAYCLLDEQERIHKWSLLDVRGTTLVDQVMAKLKGVPMAETVVIEQQPKIASEPVKAVMHYIEAYYVLKGCRVILVSPKRKLTVYQGPDVNGTVVKSAHARNKYLAMEHCRLLLTASDQMEWPTIFEAEGKKDDLADAYLQGLWYLRQA